MIQHPMTNRTCWLLLLLMAEPLAACHRPRTRGPLDAYPPVAPLASDTGMPAWLDAPQDWAPGDWVEYRDEGLVGRDKERRRLRLVSRSAAGQELWEAWRHLGSSRAEVEVAVTALALGQRALRQSFKGKRGGEAASTYLSAGSWPLSAILSGFAFLKGGQVVPRRGDYDRARFDRDDVKVAGRRVPALRLEYRKSMKGASMVMWVWLSDRVPGKVLRILARGYLLGMPILSREVVVTGFGRDPGTPPSLRLPLIPDR